MMKDTHRHGNDVALARPSPRAWCPPPPPAVKEAERELADGGEGGEKKQRERKEGKKLK